MDDRADDAQASVPQDPGAPPAAGRWSLRHLRHPPKAFGADAAARRELERRVVHRHLPASEAPEFQQEHRDLDALAAGCDPRGRDAVVRVLEVAAAMVDEERALRLAAERKIAADAEAARQSLAQRADDAGLPVDTQAALEDAVSACGRMNHVAARKRLGDRLYDAIAGLGHGCSWAWLCQQPILSMPQIARRIDQRLGRDHVPSKRTGGGGGSHFARQTRGQRVAVPKEQLPELLLGLVRGAKVFVPLEELAEYRLTAGDWNFLVGQVLKRVEMGFVAHSRFAAYLLESVRRHEENHRIPAAPRPQEAP